MKKHVIVMALVFSLVLFSSPAMAKKWNLYDDFEGYPLGPFVENENWELYPNPQDVADITIEELDGNQVLKFTYRDNDMQGSRRVHLRVRKDWGTVVGIRADMMVSVCHEDLDGMARIGWHTGLIDDNYDWVEVLVRPNHLGRNHYVVFRDLVFDHLHNYQYLYQNFWSHFRGGPSQILGKWYRVTVQKIKNRVRVTVDGEGAIEHVYETAFRDPVEAFKSIGIYVWPRENYVSDRGFQAYFDNIYVLRSGKMDKKGPKLKKVYPKKLEQDNCSIDLTFSEPIALDFKTVEKNWDIQAPDEWQINESAWRWEPDLKTLHIHRNDCGVPLPAGAKLKFILNPNAPYGPDEPHFKDIYGNQIKTRSITLKVKK